MPIDSSLINTITQQRNAKAQSKAQPDPLDTISKALNIAGSVYNIKDAFDKSSMLKEQNAQAASQREFANKSDLAGKGLMVGEDGGIVDDPNSSFYKQRVKKGESDPFAIELKKLQIENLKTKGEQAKKTSITPGQKQVDAKFAQDYVDWNAAGGIAGSDKQLAQLSGAITELENDTSLTGAGKGLAGSLGIRSFTNPKAVEIKQQVENAINGSLRATLGSAFTEKEGQRIFNQSYDESLPPEANIRKIKATMANLKSMADAKDEASIYFEEHGTLAGFTPASQRDDKTLTPQEMAAAALIRKQGLKTGLKK